MLCFVPPPRCGGKQFPVVSSLHSISLAITMEGTCFPVVPGKVPEQDLIGLE